MTVCMIATTPYPFGDTEIAVHHDNTKKKHYFLVEDVITILGFSSAEDFLDKTDSYDSAFNEGGDWFIEGETLLAIAEALERTTFSKWLSDLIESWKKREEPIAFASTHVRKRLEHLLKQRLSDMEVIAVTLCIYNGLFGSQRKKKKNLTEDQIVDLLFLEYHLCAFLVERNSEANLDQVTKQACLLADRIKAVRLAYVMRAPANLVSS